MRTAHTKVVDLPFSEPAIQVGTQGVKQRPKRASSGMSGCSNRRERGEVSATFFWRVREAASGIFIS